VHDIKAVRTHGAIDALAEVSLVCYGDKSYQGAGGTVGVPFRGKRRDRSVGQQAVNIADARIRAVGEQAMATLKSWRLLRKLRCSTTRITGLVQAVLALLRRMGLRLEKAQCLLVSCRDPQGGHCRQRRGPPE
jgi:hypothetical protein